MSRTVTAFFDTREEAQAAKARLQSSSIDADRIRIIDKDSGMGAGGGTGDSRGFYGSLSDFFMPDEDRYAYREGLNRGGYLLCAEVDERQADEAVRVLEDTSSVDLDERVEQWRGDGWAGWTGGTMNNQTVATSGTPLTADRDPDERPSGAEHLPLREAEQRVGQRDADRCSGRVRSYVPGPHALGERTVEMTATSEEAVIGKEARVTEEVVISKTADERVERIDETVRRTEAQVERDPTPGDRNPAPGERSPFGFGDDKDRR